MQGTIAVFLFCMIASIKGQYMHPLTTMGTGGVWGSPMGTGHLGWRGQSGPGVMQTSQTSSVAYPTWKSHPLFRMAAAPTDKNTNLLQVVPNVPKVPSAQEVLTHMALGNPITKPFVDTISGFLYSPESITSRQAVVAPVYLQGMNVMRANPSYIDDCTPEVRFDRETNDWLY